MIIQVNEIKELLDEFNEVASKAQNVSILCRDIDIQKDHVYLLTSFIEKSNALKNSNKGRFSEPELNLILFLIFSIEAVKHELEMLIQLKENEASMAWGSLVQAQTKISIAIANHPFDQSTLQGYLSRLEGYEKLLFPKMVFASAGYLIKKTRCTICGLEYEECDHMKGKFYNGELCVCEIHEAELEEASMVENPANKMCRVISTTIDGKEVDALTLKGKDISSKTYTKAEKQQTHKNAYESWTPEDDEKLELKEKYDR